MARPCSQKSVVATKTPPALRRFDSQSPRIRHVAVRCSVRCWRILWLDVSCWLDGWSMAFIEQVSCAYHEIAMPWAAMSFGLFASACATCSASHCPSQGSSLSQCSDETCRCGSSNSCVGKDLKLHSKGRKKTCGFVKQMVVPCSTQFEKWWRTIKWAERNPLVQLHQAM